MTSCASSRGGGSFVAEKITLQVAKRCGAFRREYLGVAAEGVGQVTQRDVVARRHGGDRGGRTLRQRFHELRFSGRLYEHVEQNQRYGNVGANEAVEGVECLRQHKGAVGDAVLSRERLVGVGDVAEDFSLGAERFERSAAHAV